MKKASTLKTGAVLFGLAASLALVTAAQAGNPLPQPVVYVTSQDLYYDSLVPTDLPPEGPFQQLDPNGPHGGPQTEFGPGDPGYLGGRWWVDVNNDGEMDEGDAYFLCPLRGPGRETP